MGVCCPPGTSSSTSPGALCPSGYDFGHMGFNKQELVSAPGHVTRVRTLASWRHSKKLPPHPECPYRPSAQGQADRDLVPDAMRADTAGKKGSISSVSAPMTREFLPCHPRTPFTLPSNSAFPPGLSR
ncbi:hypothetical protein GDI2990 [Gluconacetobacter diazotrophicus PA1 5]|uniref:Uncharacterized protein n=1 Tax=Gluconacetobacter diazotrophicus (strain ATCC 49037 / DSM 5601 / CCUG 37298 / CIP 103539 / LMG 7603 / PAl5) TaxID=272568 RepID=A9HRK8_GLUDA|nr:hypothetical protein GDI2990 [Gluconacetobacter diazotrophicus PA1 5]